MSIDDRDFKEDLDILERWGSEKNKWEAKEIGYLTTIATLERQIRQQSTDGIIQRGLCKAYSTAHLGKGGVRMATSTIFANFDITEPKAAERFVAALEESEEREKDAPPITIYPVMDDLDEIRRFVARRKSSQ